MPLRSLTRLWHQLQVHRRGKYSLERLQALHAFAQSRSLTRVVLTIVLTPLPALLVVAGLECLPLQPPAAGWRASWALWVRLALSAFAVCESASTATFYALPELCVSVPRRLFISLVTALAYTCSLMLLAARWVFPVPFTVALGAVPATAFYVSLFTLATRGAMRGNAPLQRSFRAFVVYLAVQMLMVIVYPAFHALFVAADPQLRPGLVLVLPLLKLAFKNLVARFAAPWEDLIPEMTIFSVELFNSLYMVTCMQGDASVSTTAVVLAMDAAQCALTLRGMGARTQQIAVLQRRAMREVAAHSGDAGAIDAVEARDHTFSRITRGGGAETLLDVALRLCEHPDRLDKTQLSRIRVCTTRRSGIVSPTTTRMLATLQASTDNHNEADRKPIPALLKLAAVVPAPALAPAQRVAATSEHHRTELLVETLQLLFHTEYVVLVEYMECVIPLLYATHVGVLAQLRNGAFYPHTASLSRSALASTLLNVAVYALLEAASLLLAHALVRRRFGVSLLVQLAFVLEQQGLALQTKVLMYLLIMLQFNLVHLGADFSFRFAWLH